EFLAFAHTLSFGCTARLSHFPCHSHATSLRFFFTLSHLLSPSQSSIRANRQWVIPRLPIEEKILFISHQNAVSLFKNQIKNIVLVFFCLDESKKKTGNEGALNPIRLISESEIQRNEKCE